MADVIDELWEANRQGWSLDKLERLVGLSKRQLIRIMHGQQTPRRPTVALMQHAVDILAGRICQHLDCDEPADYRLTVPPPIDREESACHYHAQPLLGNRIPNITIQEI